MWKMININYITTEIKKYKNILCINYITTMELSRENINNRSQRSVEDMSQINQLENEFFFKDIEYKCKKSEYNRRYYLKHR